MTRFPLPKRPDNWAKNPIQHLLATWILGAVFGSEVVLYIIYPQTWNTLDTIIVSYALFWLPGRSFLIWWHSRYGEELDQDVVESDPRV